MSYAGYLHVKNDGLIGHMPGGLQNLMLETSIFDILTAVFIERRMSKLVISVVSPFMQAHSKEEVKVLLDENYREGKFSQGVYKSIYRTGILNNFPKKAI
eukprot:CAMPEP_0116880260 /NCGR_PEP_ID=MMETSP0463-20121206/12170_1 /TAXON_ID=181622 /ORGANISM="Strombidinopsis sp, Strain SopsisLIS2011" /LENGTH=99 /DNA_ID=CAMNT_0004530623 /DNA_START=856 /DNA_END=1155 /DNA_ORIENTATION=-